MDGDTKAPLNAAEDAILTPFVEEGTAHDEREVSKEAPYAFLGREGEMTGEYHKPDKAEQERQKKRSLVIALVLVCFMLLIFATTVLRIGQAANSGVG